jgi:hypothetical protein
LLGIPLEELLPGIVGIGAVVAYLRVLPGSWRRCTAGNFDRRAMKGSTPARREPDLDRSCGRRGVLADDPKIDGR